eukprot:11990161-Alexandrium_andersonii.AAC.1
MAPRSLWAGCPVASCRLLERQYRGAPRYHELFRTRLDPDGRPVPYEIFRECPGPPTRAGAC